MVTRIRTTIVLLALAFCAAAVPARAQDDDSVRALLSRIERVVRDGDTAGYFALLSAVADRSRAQEFASSELMPGVNRVRVSSARRHLAARRQAHRRGRRAGRVDDCESGAGLVGRKHLPRVAQRREAVRRP